MFRRRDQEGSFFATTSEQRISEGEQKNTHNTSIYNRLKQGNDTMQSTYTPSFRSTNYSSSDSRSAARGSSEGQRHSDDDSSQALQGVDSQRRLTVGNGITVEGGVISNCDLLIISGIVKAKLDRVNAINITSTGCFEGIAEVQEAEISGVFKGELKVSGHVIIHSTAVIEGMIIYDTIEIKSGAKLTGQVVHSDSFKNGGYDNSSFKKNLSMNKDRNDVRQQKLDVVAA